MYSIQCTATVVRGSIDLVSDATIRQTAQSVSLSSPAVEDELSKVQVARNLKDAVSMAAIRVQAKRRRGHAHPYINNTVMHEPSRQAQK